MNVYRQKYLEKYGAIHNGGRLNVPPETSDQVPFYFSIPLLIVRVILLANLNTIMKANTSEKMGRINFWMLFVFYTLTWILFLYVVYPSDQPNHLGKYIAGGLVLLISLGLYTATTILSNQIKQEEVSGNKKGLNVLITMDFMIMLMSMLVYFPGMPKTEA